LYNVYRSYITGKEVERRQVSKGSSFAGPRACLMGAAAQIFLGALDNEIFLRFPGQWEDGVWWGAMLGGGSARRKTDADYPETSASGPITPLWEIAFLVGSRRRCALLGKPVHSD